MTSMSVAARRPVVSIKKQKPSGNKRPQMQLTRRGRFVFRGLPLLTLLALIVLGALTFISPFEAKAEDRENQKALVSITVKSGQSLWDIAYQAEPQADTRDVIERIMDINDLNTAKIDAGQTLLIPVISAK